MCICHQGKRKCECKDNYIGDGIDCEAKQLPVNRCLQDNGQCHSDAQCTDLHYEGMFFMCTIAMAQNLKKWWVLFEIII